MKVDLDFSMFSRFFRGLVNDFGQKKLWPVAVVLLAAIIAVPVLLSKTSSPAPVAQAPLPTPPPATGSSLPTINVQPTPSVSRLTGSSHNPFAQGSGGTSVTSTGTTSSATGIGSTTSPASTTSTGSTTSGGTTTSSTSSSPSTSTSSGTTPAVSPPSITGNSKPKPAPTGLTPTQSYDVGLAITNSAGGVNTTDPLKRLSPIPSDQQPLLVELGVLRHGGKVLFAVEPGTVVNGPGTCTPGPIDCEVLSLGQDQTESISSRDTGANALFAVTGISAVTHSSVAEATRTREAKSAAGQAVLDGTSGLTALSLFKYEPSVGSVVDLRDLGVN